MIWGYLFIALILAAAVYVLLSGERDARFAILTLIAGSALSVLAVYWSGQYFESASGIVAAVDFLIFGIFLWQSLTSRRHWTLALPALQLIVCTTHLAKLIAPDIIPRVYSGAQGHWSYYQIAIIIFAAYMHRLRRSLLMEWKRSRQRRRGGTDV